MQNVEHIFAKLTLVTLGCCIPLHLHLQGVLFPQPENFEADLDCNKQNDDPLKPEPVGLT